MKKNPTPKFVVSDRGTEYKFESLQDAQKKFEELVDKYVKHGVYLMKDDDGYRVGDKTAKLRRSFGTLTVV